MKAKITFPLLTFFMFVNNKYSQFDVSKSWTDLVQAPILQSQKNINPYQFITPLRVISINFDSSPLGLKV